MKTGPDQCNCIRLPLEASRMSQIMNPLGLYVIFTSPKLNENTGSFEEGQNVLNLIFLVLFLGFA